MLTAPLRRRISRTLSISHPTRPRSIVSQTYATSTAFLRELSYPSVLHFSQPWIQWLSPPPLGQFLAIITYWAIVTLFLTTGSIIHDAYYWERIGFRAAWISVTQVPLIYLLAGKVNVAGVMLGSSGIDLNWVHRWVSRTLIVTATIHGGFFITEWVRADFFQGELEMMPMVKWGIGAWGILVWTATSSLFPFRRLCYELFVIQHIASGAIFLWVLHKHVPSYAAYNVWMAVAFLVSGRFLRACIFIFRNVSSSGLGHVAEIQAMPGNITRLTIQDAKFTWKPGQHVLLWCPFLGPTESHPFTIATIPQQKQDEKAQRLELIIRARSGFTRRLYQKASSSYQMNPLPIHAFITGPFHTLPAWNTFETLVLISAFTGASFILPILENVLNDPCCVSRIDCTFLARHRSHLDAYLPRIQAAAAAASHHRAAGIESRIVIAVTGREDVPQHGENNPLPSSLELKRASGSSYSSEGVPSDTLLMKSPESNTKLNQSLYESHHDKNNNSSPNPPTSTSTHDDEKPFSPPTSTIIYTSSSRPSLSTTIRTAVESSAGETCVVVCGGKALTSDVRGIVSGLADERAVHKGTGAQGIRLWVEGFGS